MKQIHLIDILNIFPNWLLAYLPLSHHPSQNCLIVKKTLRNIWMYCKDRQKENILPNKLFLLSSRSEFSPLWPRYLAQNPSQLHKIYHSIMFILLFWTFCWWNQINRFWSMHNYFTGLLFLHPASHSSLLSAVTMPTVQSLTRQVNSISQTGKIWGNRPL